MNLRGIADRVAARLGLYEKEYLIEGMAQVGPKVTMFPLWIQIRQQSKHKEPSIKVRLNDGMFKQREGTSVVSINDIRVIQGEQLSQQTLDYASDIIERSKDRLLDYWYGRTYDTQEVIDAMRPIKE